MKKRIAFFDFDGTITIRDSMLELIRHEKGWVRFLSGFFILSPYMLAMKFKFISNQAAKEKLLSYFFKGVSHEEFQKKCDDFSSFVLPALIRPAAMETIEKLKHENVEVVIVSASAGNWIKEWCETNNLTLISTTLEVKNGKITGRIKGKNCHGVEKVRRIQETYQVKDYDEIYAYGDTKSDLPMLQIATLSFFKPFR